MKPLAANVLIQDRYLIVHLIGKGGMGEVYLAVDQRLGSAVALKRTFFKDDEMLATAFEREARILANLRHPILPKVSDHFIEGENQFLVMEHITGDDLSKRLEKTQQPFPLSWVLFWADQLLDALNYLHTHEPPIIHRDIKPQNLKLTNDNHIVLLDFGLSKNSVGETRTSSTGSIVGYTPHYAPMEQIRGTGTNAQSDLYSLSATIYQLITNMVPPDALTRADSLLSGLPDPLRPINELNKEVTPEVSEVILKGMDIRQDSRFESAREMQKKLRDAYSRLQSAMSAQTIAFSLEDQQVETVAEPVDSLPKVPESESPEVTTGSDRSSSGDLPVDSGGFQQSGSGSLSEHDSHPKPSDVKTEVLLAGESPVIASYQSAAPTESAESSETEQGESPVNFGFDDDESAEFGISDESDADNAGFTVSINDSDESVDEMDAFEGVGGQGDTAFFSSIDVEDSQNAGATFIADRTEIEEDSQAAAASATASPSVPAAANAKSSGGKKFLVIGSVLVLMFILLGGAGAVGWYVLQGRNTGTVQETPTPEPTVEVSPTPSATPEEIFASDESNTNTENTNTETAAVNSDPAVKPVTQSTRPATTPAPGRPTPRPTAVTRPTSNPTPAPTKKPSTGGILQ